MVCHVEECSIFRMFIKCLSESTMSAIYSNGSETNKEVLR